ncbi:MAG: hypothetical protein WC789_00740 [Lentisphaeria bacterium]|jgi:type II secretory pathway pseudopilin PulG
MIIVLAILALAALLAGATVSESQLAAGMAHTANDQERAAWLAESAVNRTQWLLLQDITAYPDRTLDQPTTPTGLDSRERFRADGVAHRFPRADGDCTVTITDMASGWDLNLAAAGTAGLQTLGDLFSREPARREAFTDLLDKIQDYSDTDDLVRRHGLEREDYARAGQAPLPRNAQPQFREELLWIPGAADFFPADPGSGRLPELRLVPPPGLARPAPSLRPSFFTATERLLRARLGLDETAAKTVLDARRRWQEEAIPLESSLDASLRSRLRQEFLFRESGYYTVTATATAGEGRPGRTLVASFRADRTMASPFLRYHEWQWQ